MDNLKRLLQESIQFRLSFWLALAILIIAILAGIFSFLSALHEAHELQDDVLRQIAALVDRQHLPLHQSQARDLKLASDEESRVIVQYLNQAETRQGNVDSGAPLLLPSTLPDGMHTLKVAGERYRAIVKTEASGERILVAQETDIRDEIAADSALRTLMPFLVLVPILLLVVADLVRKIFRPITLLAAEIDNRREQELHPVEATHLPAEVRPFAIAINRLLSRVAQVMTTQRRFVADAAHELRSPLTALSLQAERLADADMSAQARERLGLLRQGIERNRNLLEQLLTLARTQSTAPLPGKTVSVLQVYRRVVEDLMPLAEAKQIDIGVEGSSDLQIFISEADLIATMMNLIDNAIRYTPKGGRIDLSASADAGQTILQVKDSGLGIAPEERKRVFDPFYRVLGNDQVGSGLGLSIVKAIANRIGAEVHLAFSDEIAKTGLCVSVLIPTANH